MKRLVIILIFISVVSFAQDKETKIAILHDFINYALQCTQDIEHVELPTIRSWLRIDEPIYGELYQWEPVLNIQVVALGMLLSIDDDPTQTVYWWKERTRFDYLYNK